jgi:hypothetical protein
VASACALALSALTAFGSGEPSALAASKYPTPATTVANVTHAQAGVLASYVGSTVTGVGWTRESVNSSASPAGSDAAVTLNGVSQNIAVFGPTGDLDFYWQSDDGVFTKEVIAPAGAN